ncbi:acetate kinase [Alteromonas aestuariivivens]|uniref:Acetate kinase n=1 Tax=Alteromonas aestuariivivens TaxID=1938339 RepID=A0A3D8M3A8_9ALTE|nr:acetate kinase [Alteromonas aestuariivivens]RDV24108.1 acetate kinase [Alteromonas aestuariivivens]
MHQIIVLNCGSSSIKFAIMDADSGEASLTGVAENLGNSDARIKYKTGQQSEVMPLPEYAEHKLALASIQALISEQNSAPLAVGHRVVHGGETFTQSVLIDDEVKHALKATFHMAPLHNPAALQGIESAQEAFPDLPHVAVFDTAFFQTMPKHAYLYALPKALYEEHGIRRYGFHGSSHYFVSHEAARYLGKPIEQCNLITAHLGNGCSIAAIRQGQAVDTSLGFTPLEGLVMGTRCGDICPSLPGVLSELLGYNTKRISEMLNRESGLLGISGLSNDCRTLEEAAESGNEDAALALHIFCYRLAKYIGSYMVVTGPLDAIVFTGGIGENSSWIRETVIGMLEHLGHKVDPEKNLAARFGKAGNIAATALPIWVIPTNEEWVIARDALNISKQSN